MIHKKTSLIIIVSSLLLSQVGFAKEPTSTEQDAVAKRIKPVGNVYLVQDEVPVDTNAASAVRTGESIYNTYCTACHSTGISGAPKPGNASDWQPRIAQGQDTLKQHAIQGFNAMPPKGTCSDCSDEEIVKAIEFMTKDL